MRDPKLQEDLPAPGLADDIPEFVFDLHVNGGHHYPSADMLSMYCW